MKSTKSIYWYNRCYLRGFSLLGLFNTCVGCLFDRVLVRSRMGKIVKWHWGTAHHWCRESDRVTYEKKLFTVPSRECTVLGTMLLVPFRFNRGGFVEYAYCEMDEVDSLILLEQYATLVFEVTGNRAILKDRK